MNKTCTNCGEQFTVTTSDQQFYETMQVPPPTHCPLCRMQRRLANRSERFLYHRKCDLTGKQVISTYSTDKPHTVYDIDEWWSDKWDAKEYGREFDFSRPFFDQFRELRETVPRLARIQQKPMENSDWCNCVSRLRNSYLLFSSNEDEDCYYGSWVNQCTDCIDSYILENCELCYECTCCRDCYNLRYSQDCMNCKDSMFLKDCIGCTSCFCCTNQNNATYMFMNEQKTKEEYEALMQQVNTGSFTEMQIAKNQQKKLLQNHIVKEFYGTNIEDSVGDYLRDCKNVQVSFACDHCEDVSYSQCLQNAKSSMDHSYWGQNSEQIYECQACGYDLSFLRFCNLCWSGCSNLTYCDHCFSSKNCFGCVGLRKDEYCIFNKQYTKDEYEELVPKIIEHMRSTNEWGEFFPITMAPYAYNETLSYEEIPLTKEEVLQKGWQWIDEEEQQKQSYMGPDKEVPDSIADVSESICDDILICQESQKPYKIIPQELKFYKQQNIPIPRTCPDARHWERLGRRNPRKLWNRTCAKCSKEIQTTYAPERPETVYCEECYLKEVY